MSAEEQTNLEYEVMELASAISAAQGRMLDLIADYETRAPHPEEQGPAAWLAWAAGMKRSTAAAHVKLAARLTELPQLRTALRRGEISFDKAEVVSKVATPDTEATLLMWAKDSLASQLQSLASGYRRAKRLQDEADAAHLSRCLSYYTSDDGTFRMRVQLSAEEGAIVAKAIEAAAELVRDEQRTFKNDELDENRQAEVRWHEGHDWGRLRADALVALSDSYLSQRTRERGEGDRFQVVLHVDAAALEGDEFAGAELEDGGVGLAPETWRRLSCDCSVLAMLERDGVPLKLSRKRRTVSRALRRALKVRDGHCVFPGCTCKLTEAHHVLHWIAGGETEPDNLSLLCPRHHRLVHEGGYRMEFTGKGLPTFYRPDGSLVERVPTSRSLSEVELAEWRRAASIEPDAWVHHIDRFELDVAVEWLREKDAAGPFDAFDPIAPAGPVATPGPTPYLDLTDAQP